MISRDFKGCSLLFLIHNYIKVQVAAYAVTVTILKGLILLFHKYLDFNLGILKIQGGLNFSEMSESEIALRHHPK